MCSRPSMAVSSLPLHAGDPFSSFSIQVLSKLVNWEKSETIYKRIQTTDQYHPLCNFLKDQTDKQYLIAILRDFFNLRKLKRILLSSADKIECGLSSAKGWVSNFTIGQWFSAGSPGVWLPKVSSFYCTSGKTLTWGLFSLWLWSSWFAGLNEYWL